MHKTKLPFSIIAVFIAILFSACRNDVIFHQHVNINPEGWHKDSAAVFVFNATDTVGIYDVIIEIRNRSEYPFRNLYLFVYSISPDGTVRGDTLNCILADSHGRWHGRGIGSYSLPILYMPNVYFPVAGEYIFEIRQGMRAENLIGISSIGLRIQKTTAN